MKTYRLPYGLSILHEDRELIVVDKPSGLLSVAAGAEKEKTVYWILCEYLRKRGEKRRVASVHRLDRDTSGVMVFAKSGEAKQALMSDWNNTVVQRRYVALAEGDFPVLSGTFDAPLGEDRGGRVVVQEGGQSAITHWRVLDSGGGYTLVELELETGRRNQIRAHLDWAERPIAGDSKYGARSDPIRRLALHAESLSIKHPRTGEVLSFTVPVPKEFYKPLQRHR
ncbi:hypothetical protein MASR2M78_24940 [Treponema sp.]